LAGGWAWLCALGTHWVTYWPELTSLVIGAHTVREATGRVLSGVRRCSGATAEGVRRGVGVARRAAVAGRRVIGGCWVRVVCPAAIMTGWLAGRVGMWGWRWVEPPVRDAAGWLVHTAPGLVGHLLLRLAGWLPVALARVVRHAVVGLGWLLARWGRYCLAYPDYAGIVREAHELDRPRWRAYSRSPRCRGPTLRQPPRDRCDELGPAKRADPRALLACTHRPLGVQAGPTARPPRAAQESS
jgi:hypothetical protein